MEGDTEKTKISYLHHWLNGDGISKIEGWKNSKTLISQAEYDALENKTGKYSLDKIESLLIYSVPHFFHLAVLVCCSSLCFIYGHRQSCSQKNWN